MGKSDPQNPNVHKQQSIVIVPANAPGVRVVRPMQVFGYDDAPEGHCEVVYENVKVPVENLVLGWGRGFEVRCAISRLSILLTYFALDYPRTARVRITLFEGCQDLT